MAVNRFKVPGVAFLGSWWLPFMPKRSAKLTTVVGKPLELPSLPRATKEDVALWHGKYVTALQELFDRHVGKYGDDPNAKMEVF